ncbi:MAG TPA: FAD-dependent oxidoreductase [Mycobacteriales bacterium]|nr:FAD-dependent oxidoreductase [Mycobacteriales bacterium]
MTTSTADQTFVVVGASLAGGKAVEALRAEGFAGRLVLIGDEPERPYERPPLSKGYLLGSEEREKVFVHEAGWYAEHGVELRLSTVVASIDRAAREVVLDGGERIGYDRLLLTTGSVVRRLDVPGADLAGVEYLRRLGDADRISAMLATDRRVVVIGGGWIGLELAAAARLREASVTLVEVLDLPLQRVLGDELGRIFADLHREHGVELRLGVGVREIRGAGGAVSSVVLADGTELPADLVLVGVGIAPAVALAEAAGLAVDNGVLVDAALRTSDPDIFAAGDVANAEHPLLGERIRVEHWANALNGGPAAARAMLGQEVSYDQIPYFFSDQYDLGMEYAGWAPPGRYDQVVFRGDVPGREFIAFWLRDGRVVAGMNVNIWDVSDDIQDLIRAGGAVDPARLTDPKVPLAEV